MQKQDTQNKRGGSMYGYSAMGDKNGTILQVLRHNLKTGEQTVVYKKSNHIICNVMAKIKN